MLIMKDIKISQFRPRAEVGGSGGGGGISTH